MKREYRSSQSSLISSDLGTISRELVIKLLLVTKYNTLINIEVPNSDKSLRHLGQVYDFYITYIFIVKNEDNNDTYFIAILNKNAGKYETGKMLNVMSEIQLIFKHLLLPILL